MTMKINSACKQLYINGALKKRTAVLKLILIYQELWKVQLSYYNKIQRLDSLKVTC